MRCACGACSPTAEYACQKRLDARYFGGASSPGLHSYVASSSTCAALAVLAALAAQHSRRQRHGVCCLGGVGSLSRSKLSSAVALRTLLWPLLDRSPKCAAEATLAALAAQRLRRQLLDVRRGGQMNYNSSVATATTKRALAASDPVKLSSAVALRALLRPFFSRSSKCAAAAVLAALAAQGLRRRLLDVRWGGQTNSNSGMATATSGCAPAASDSVAGRLHQPLAHR